MKHLLKFILAASILSLTACSEKTETTENTTNTDTLASDTAIQIPTVDSITAANDMSDKLIEPAKTEVLTLLSGRSGEDATHIEFTNAKGDTLYSWNVPENTVQWDETEWGQEINKKNCNVKYSVTYEIKKLYHEPSASWETCMVISAMSKK